MQSVVCFKLFESKNRFGKYSKTLTCIHYTILSSFLFDWKFSWQEGIKKETGRKERNLYNGNKTLSLVLILTSPLHRPHLPPISNEGLDQVQSAIILRWLSSKFYCNLALQVCHNPEVIVIKILLQPGLTILKAKYCNQITFRSPLGGNNCLWEIFNSMCVCIGFVLFCKYLLLLIPQHWVFFISPWFMEY
jgi:hypothetical protein